MKRFYKVFGFMSVLFALLAMNVDGQVRYVDVDPGIGTLNDAIAGDTTETGDRIDEENTVYRLQRGDEAYYGLTGSISNSGYALTIVAEDGDGARPFLQPRNEGEGSSRAFRPKGDITLSGLHVTNLDQLGGLNDRILRCDDDGIRVELDDCWFDQSSQSFIRVDDPDMTFVITNCVVSNIGLPASPNNGRGIDDRGNDIDTVIIENSTFFNLTSRILRDDGGVIKYARVNNNTIVNNAQMALSFGSCYSLEMTNNLAMNAGYYPMDDDEEWYVFSIDSVGDTAPVVNVSNNTAYVDTTLIEDWLNDSTSVTPLMNETMTLAIDAAGQTADAFEYFDIEFIDGPPLNDSIFIYDYDPDLVQDDAPDWVVPDLPDDGNGIYFTEVYYDFGYSNTEAFTGGTDGMQLGDRNWVASYSVGIDPVMVKDNLGLTVYPMPVSDYATIYFDLDVASEVEIDVYSVIGQKVASVAQGKYTVGSHDLNWNTSELESGIYIIRMNAGGTVNSIKIMKN